MGGEMKSLLVGKNGFLLWLAILVIHAVVTVLSDYNGTVEWASGLARFRVLLMLAMLIHLGWLVNSKHRR